MPDALVFLTKNQARALLSFDELTSAMRQALIDSQAVESREAAEREPGDILIPRVKVNAEIGELLDGAEMVKGKHAIVFKSVGIAVEDIAAAKLVYDKFATNLSARNEQISQNDSASPDNALG